MKKLTNKIYKAMRAPRFLELKLHIGDRFLLYQILSNLTKTHKKAIKQYDINNFIVFSQFYLIRYTFSRNEIKFYLRVLVLQRYVASAAPLTLSPY